MLINIIFLESNIEGCDYMVSNTITSAPSLESILVII